jgi:hypothetical protein
MIPQGGTPNSPAGAYANGKLYLAVQGSYQTIWIGSVTLSNQAFSGWIPVTGETNDAPSLASNGTHLFLAVRAYPNNDIFYRIYTCATESWATNWIQVPNGWTCDRPAIAILGNVLHFAVRGLGNQYQNDSIWHNYVVNPDNPTFAGWTQLPGSTDAPLSLTASPLSNKIYLAAKGENQLVWINTYGGNTWQGWINIGGGVTFGPAITIKGNNLDVVVQNYVIWHCTLDANNPASWNNPTWEMIDGYSPSAPAFAG